ncbi:serine O-acetyltransferase [Acinetobacter pittii]|uniref:serine O-acetyltransferase n=1 Tax=Acinetobacter pittii TaxID=48296 RepID=UPI002DBDB5B4|nr:serine O-acetyltransferase [Acinetobacter pittii]
MDQISNINATRELSWLALQNEITRIVTSEPLMSEYLQKTFLQQNTLEEAISHLLANKLSSNEFPASQLITLFSSILTSSGDIANAIQADLAASIQRDPSVCNKAIPLMNHKGFHALQSYRISHYLWNSMRRPLALYIQNRMSEVFAIDIHPAAVIGKGVFIDHGTGIVIGETAKIDDNVSLFQGVTLGGTGKQQGNRHPKIQAGAIICAGATVLGNINVGIGAKIGAGSVVLKDVPPYTTVVGIPAKIVNNNLPNNSICPQAFE